MDCISVLLANDISKKNHNKTMYMVQWIHSMIYRIHVKKTCKQAVEMDEL